jgi:urease accessory protein UreF
MNIKTTYKSALAALVALLVAVGCSKQSSDSSEAADSEVPEVADKKMTKAIDKMAEEVLQDTDKMEAADWLKRYPKSEIGQDEEGRPILLAAIVARLNQAGAQRIVIQFVKLGQAELLTAMVVVLPTDSAARQKIFAMEAELSQLCDQTQVTDRGQKYLHYGFD